MNRTIRGISSFWTLTGATALFLIIFLGPTLRAQLHVNLFSLRLAHVWSDAMVLPTDAACPGIDNADLLQRMQTQLQKAATVDAHQALHAGELACLAGDADQAVQSWSKASALDPVTFLLAATLQFRSGVLLPTHDAEGIGKFASKRGAQAQEDNLETAFKWLEMAVAYDANAGNINKLASLYKKNDQPEKVLTLWLAQQENRTPDEPMYWFSRAKAQELEKDWSEAARFYLKAGELEKDIKQAASYYRTAGNAAKRAKLYDMAQEAYQRALDVQPDSISNYLAMGDLYRAQKMYDEAARWYERAQQRFPKDYQPDYRLGLLARDQKDYEKALSYFQRALKLKPEQTTVLYYKASVLDALQRRQEATQVLAQAIALHNNPPQSWQDLLAKWQRNPDYAQDPDRWWEKGHEAEKEKDWARAAAIYHEGAAAAQPPDDQRLLNREALMLRYLKQWEQAAAIYEDLITRYPDKIDNYLGHGEVARAQKLYDEAASWFRRAQERFPEDHRPPYYLGLVARDNRQYEDALLYFDDSLFYRPNNSYTHYAKAQVLKTLKLTDEAVTELSLAIKLHPEHPDNWKRQLGEWKQDEQK